MGPLFKALEAVFELCIPLVVKLIIDVGIGNADRAYIVMMVTTKNSKYKFLLIRI